MDSDGSGTEEEYVPRSGEETDGSDSCSTGVEEEEEEEGTAPTTEEEGESIVTPAKKVCTHSDVCFLGYPYYVCMIPAHSLVPSPSPHVQERRVWCSERFFLSQLPDQRA